MGTLVRQNRVIVATGGGYLEDDTEMPACSSPTHVL